MLFSVPFSKSLKANFPCPHKFLKKPTQIKMEWILYLLGTTLDEDVDGLMRKMAEGLKESF